MKNNKVVLSKVLVGDADMYYTAFNGKYKVLPVLTATGLSIKHWSVQEAGKELFTGFTLREVRGRLSLL